MKRNPNTNTFFTKLISIRKSVRTTTIYKTRHLTVGVSARVGTEGLARNPGSPAIRSAMEDDDVDESVLDLASEPESMELSDAAMSEPPASLRFSSGSADGASASDMEICSDCSESPRSVGGASFEIIKVPVFRTCCGR